MLTLAFLLLSMPWVAPSDSTEADTLLVSRQLRVMVLPIVFTSPDTRWAGGVLPQAVFHLPGAWRSSTARVDAYYTQNGQFSVRARPTVWFADDMHTAALNVAWKKWPTTFYGIGSLSTDSLSESYSELFVEGSSYVLRRFAPGFYTGVRYDARYSRLADLQPGGDLERGAIPGSRGGAVSSVGLVVQYDTRDHYFYPTSGGWYQFVVRAAGPAVGSAYSFSALEVDLRQYASLSRNQTVAVQALIRLTGGGAPFQALPAVGSVFRGYETSRFIDSNLLALQAEYRLMPFFWRVGVVGFVGVGQTTRRLEDFDLRDLKYVVGTGLRVQISPKDLINVRWDYGLGLDSAGDFLDLGEAF